MACSECMVSFFYDPFKMGLVIVSLLLSLGLFIVLKKYKQLSFKKKLGIMYAHMFTLIFPFVFFALFQGCQAMFNNCSQLGKILTMLGITALISLVFGVFLGPLIYIKRFEKKSIKTDNAAKHWIHNFVKKHAIKLKIENPQIQILNEAKPQAFSIKYVKSQIFITLGLIDLLNRKEIEAVLLHELGHIKNRSSLYKFSVNLFKLVSPLASFSTFHKELSKEEHLADAFAIHIQKTNKNIISAKRKMNAFFKFSRSVS
tara:strand:+ start:515 stop:1288 length:774 start_codon:yes stop_codon:yes gene_type:complete